MDRIEYEHLPGIRRSDLWLISRSPAHYRYAVNHRPAPSKALAFGIACHAYILEPDSFGDEVAIQPECDRRTTAGREEYAEFLESVGDRVVITGDDFLKIVDMKKALQENGDAWLLLMGQHEQAFSWTDPLTGEQCKIKADCITEWDRQPIIVDYKTTDSCAPGHFERSARIYGYDFQAAMYREGVQITNLQEYRFAFVAQEKNPPYQARVYFCTDGFLDRGYDKFRELVGIYHQCKKTDTWPGYPDADLAEVRNE